MRTLYLFVLICCAGMLVRPAYELAQEDIAKYCDNSGSKDSKTRFHNCECVRATQECDADHPKPEEPGSMCKAGYCKPDHCDCSTKSCS